MTQPAHSSSSSQCFRGLHTVFTVCRTIHHTVPLSQFPMYFFTQTQPGPHTDLYTVPHTASGPDSSSCTSPLTLCLLQLHTHTSHPVPVQFLRLPYTVPHTRPHTSSHDSTVSHIHTVPHAAPTSSSVSHPVLTLPYSSSHRSLHRSLNGSSHSSPHGLT